MKAVTSVVFLQQGKIQGKTKRVATGMVGLFRQILSRIHGDIAIFLHCNLSDPFNLKGLLDNAISRL